MGSAGDLELRVIQLDPGTAVAFGFDFFMVGSCLQAVGIAEGGFLDQWNLRHPSMKLEAGDEILTVNGIKVDGTLHNFSTILGEFQTGSVQLVVAPRGVRAVQPRGPSVPPGQDRPPPGFAESPPGGIAGDCNDRCPICLEELEDNCNMVKLPCRHALHFSCAQSWLMHSPTRRRTTCPMCRAEILG